MKIITNIIYPAFALFAFACFALAPQARATCQQGCDLSNANTFLGENALISNTTGGTNTATGYTALFSNTEGIDNTATGSEALYSNTTGSNNTAAGVTALVSNTTGDYNTATGAFALKGNTTGSLNTAIGFVALESNTTGINNTATGVNALELNTTGFQNTATGSIALGNNTTGNLNTAIGFRALEMNTTGFQNTATGAFALFMNNGSNNTGEGYQALYNNTTGTSNIALGFQAGMNLTTGNNNIDIGSNGIADESNTIRIGTVGTHTNAYISGTYQTNVPRGLAVVIDSTGHLGTKGSSERFKDEIKPMNKASEAILALKPVTFRYKKEIDPERSPQFGLVAEEVAKVNPDLVARDEQGKPYTVRYEAVNAMLLNEFLKEHRKVERLTKDFESKLAEQQTQIQQLTAGLQKVSAQLEVSKAAPRTVLNNR